MPSDSRPVALLLPGQGSQHARMAAGLYPAEPVFAGAIDEVFAAWGARGERLREDWLAETPSVPVHHASWSQPLLFAVDYALGRLVTSWGIRPAALLGHSIGEMAAAVLAGVFTLPDAAALVADRVDRIVTAPPGGMLAVAASPSQVAPFLSDGVVVGAVNAPAQTVLAGPLGPLAAVAAKLAAAELTCRTVPSLSAFHSPLVAESVAGATPVIAATPRRPPEVPVYSGYTAAPLGPAEVADPGFWARHPTDPVWFWQALDALLADGEFVLVEAGPGRGLSSIARRHPAVRRGRSTVVPLLPGKPGTADADRESLAAAMAALRAEGHVLTGIPLSV